MVRILVIDEFRTLDSATIDAIVNMEGGDVCLIDYKTGDSEMFNRRATMAVALAGALGMHGSATGKEVMQQLCNTAADGYGYSFSTRYGNNPKPLNGSISGQLRKSGVAASKRAKAKRRNIAKRSSRRG